MVGSSGLKRWWQALQQHFNPQFDPAGQAGRQHPMTKDQELVFIVSKPNSCTNIRQAATLAWNVKYKDAEISRHVFIVFQFVWAVHWLSGLHGILQRHDGQCLSPSQNVDCPFNYRWSSPSILLQVWALSALEDRSWCCSHQRGLRSIWQIWSIIALNTLKGS